MTELVRLEREGACGVIVIDNPPVNVTSQGVRAGLLAAVGALAADPTLTAGVVIGAGRTFVSGADLKEFGQPFAPPETPEVMAAIAACPKRLVAALHGTAMGGGFELALACDARIGTVDLLVALPEVKLGVIPGAGGTQRTPRLIGVAKAIEFVASGRRMKAAEALSLGLIDRIAERDLRTEAIAFALSRPGKRDLAEVPVLPEPAEAIEAAAKAALAKGRGRPFIAKAVEAVRWSATMPLAEGLRQERAAFQELRTAEEAFALRHLFFAEREAGRLPETDGVAPARLDAIAVIGAGTMGSGIATAIIEAGYRTILIDSNEEARARAKTRIAETQAKALATGRIDQPTRDRRLAALSVAGSLADAASADLVIEAVFEDLAVKRQVMAELDALMKPDAILATNTSYLDVDALAAATGRRDRVLGLHFFSPANVMRLLEVVKGAETSPATLATGFALGRKLGKVAVPAGNAEGFIGNRIYNAYRNQCEFMLEDGALPYKVDEALEAFGFAMGPFRVGDLAGLDIAWATRKRQAPTRDPRARYVSILDRLCEAGRFGQKAKAGWYDHPEGAKRGVPSAFVAQAIADASAAKGIARRSVSADEIVERALGAMINEAALALADGVARRASDIDLVLVNGYGFPDWKGGPMFWASRRGPEMLARMQDRIEAATGFGFRRADLPATLGAFWG